MSGRTVTVVRPGALTTLQDRGRYGARHLAVGTAGVLDTVAAALANRLVGNPAGCAVLETTADGVALRFDHAAHVAVTGAECRVSIDGTAAAPASCLTVAAGAMLDVAAATVGVRSYVAIGSGFAVAPVLGSRSFDTLARLGPPPLARGDVVPLGAPTVPPPLDLAPRPPLTGDVEVDAWAGPRLDWLAPPASHALTSTAWTVTPSSNRIALRLAGPALLRAVTAELPSEGIVAGAVQVPPDGQPLVFLADHPTTGGYPAVAVVPEPDRARLAQLRPGDTVRFRRTGPGWKTEPS